MSPLHTNDSYQSLFENAPWQKMPGGSKRLKFDFRVIGPGEGLLEEEPK